MISRSSVRRHDRHPDAVRVHLAVLAGHRRVLRRAAGRRPIVAFPSSMLTYIWRLRRWSSFETSIRSAPASARTVSSPISRIRSMPRMRTVVPPFASAAGVVEWREPSARTGAG